MSARMPKVRVPSTLHALTLWRPWDQAILYGRKDVENRTWAPPRRLDGQFIALHAGQKWDDDGERFMVEQGFAPDRERTPAGAIVGVARLVGVHEYGAAGADTSNPWFFGPVGWFLEDRTPLMSPVPCRGAQGLWRLSITDELLVAAQLPNPVRDQVRAQIARQEAT